MPRIGVTGAAGYVGGALLPLLRRRGHSVLAVDNFSGPVRSAPAGGPVEEGDVRDPEVIRRLSECEVVLHLAAVSGVMPCANDPAGSTSVNVEATRALAESCAERGTHLVLASSFAVVGIPEKLPITEETPARPTHEYARQKAHGEEILRQVSTRTGVRFAAARMSNVYGSYGPQGQRVEKGNVLTLFAHQATSTGRLMVNAPGTQVRDFIHVEDVVRHWAAIASWLVGPAEYEPFTLFNVASAESLSILELAHRVREAWTRLFPGRRPLEVEVVPNPRGSVELLQSDFQIDRARTEALLGTRCEWALDRGIESVLRATV